MIYNINSVLPNDIIEKAIPLETIGIKEYAWEYESALKAINYLLEKDIIILGGDVYRILNGSLGITYDSWFYNVDINKGTNLNSKDSCELAVSYINNYYLNCGSGYCYSLIIK